VKYVAGKAPAKEVPASFYSTPLRLVVAPAPITLSAPAPVAVEAGSKVEVPVRVTRMYGYGDPIELALVAPSVKGVGGKATVAKDQSEAKLLVQTDAATPPGDHTIKLEAKLKLSTQTITVEQPVTLKVTAKPQAK